MAGPVFLFFHGAEVVFECFSPGRHDVEVGILRAFVLEDGVVGAVDGGLEAFGGCFEEGCLGVGFGEDGVGEFVPGALSLAGGVVEAGVGFFCE